MSPSCSRHRKSGKCKWSHQAGGTAWWLRWVPWWLHFRSTTRSCKIDAEVEEVCRMNVGPSFSTRRGAPRMIATAATWPSDPHCHQVRKFGGSATCHVMHVLRKAPCVRSHGSRPGSQLRTQTLDPETIHQVLHGCAPSDRRRRHICNLKAPICANLRVSPPVS